MLKTALLQHRDRLLALKREVDVARGAVESAKQVGDFTITLNAGLPECAD